MKATFVPSVLYYDRRGERVGSSWRRASEREGTSSILAIVRTIKHCNNVNDDRSSAARQTVKIKEKGNGGEAPTLAGDKRPLPIETNLYSHAAPGTEKQAKKHRGANWACIQKKAELKTNKNKTQVNVIAYLD